MVSSTANSERRKNSRRTPSSLIYVELGPSNGGMMRDLSADGFSLRAMMPVQAGEQIAFTFALNANARLEGHGEILWVEENGRVAGIRFVDLPAPARTLIQSWLDGTLENPEPEKPAIPKAQSFEELREELRAPQQQPRRELPSEPSAKPHWALPRPGRPEQAVPDTQSSDPVPASQALCQEETPTLTNGSAGTELAKNEQPDPYVEPITFPGLPHFTTAQEPVEIRFEPLREQHVGAPPAEETTGAVVGEEQSNRADTPVLPDISDILMQPPMTQKASGWQPLDEISLEPAAKSNWTEWFTLSRAIGIMTLLALVAGFSVYHRAFGEGLIWLGQQIGGSSATQAPPPVAEDKPPTGGTNSLGTSTPPGATVASPGISKPDTNTEVTRPLGETVPSLPETSKSSSPTAGVTSTGGPDSGQETGSAEYAHALQLLHNKNRDADLSEAVRLLWISVEKGNPSAELTLAELYWRGEGVARNCDQTRILLSAAVRKGSADAEKRLRQFEREGCE